MIQLLEQMEQCLYQLKHDQHRLSTDTKQAVNEVEIALHDLIRLIEFQSIEQEESNDSTRDIAIR